LRLFNDDKKLIDVKIELDISYEKVLIVWSHLFKSERMEGWLLLFGRKIFMINIYNDSIYCFKI
jgi:hypothetical protein